MGTAVFSVVYPGARPYFPEFLSSLAKQTCQDFTLYLINDGLEGLEELLNKVNFKYQVQKNTGLPARLRKEGIRWVISQGAETIIFADADDYFSDDRIEISKKVLADHHIVSNDLILVGKGFEKPVSMFGNLLEEKAEITREVLKTGNCMGLSNTAARTSVVAKCFEGIPDSIIAFDWALFAHCVYAGANAIFTRRTKTYYRQHSENTAAPASFTQEQIMRGVKVKSEHYRLLSKWYWEYIPQADLFESLLINLWDDEKLREAYCQAVKEQAGPYSFWWVGIKSLEELGL